MRVPAPHPALRDTDRLGEVLLAAMRSERVVKEGGKLSGVGLAQHIPRYVRRISHQHELVATPACDETIAGGSGLFQRVGNDLEGPVALDMAELIVDLFEVIDVVKEQADGVFLVHSTHA